MSRPAWLRARQGQAPAKKDREQAAVNATGRALAKLDAQLDDHGADGLAGWLLTFRDGLTVTDKACVMSRIMGRSFGRDVEADCREALLL